MSNLNWIKSSCVLAILIFSKLSFAARVQVRVEVRGTEKREIIRRFHFFDRQVLSPPQRQFRFDFGVGSDQIFMSENGGQDWDLVFNGKIDQVFLPDSPNEIDWVALQKQIPSEKRDVFSTNSYSLVWDWKLRIQSGNHLVLLDDYETYYLPWMGKVENAKVLDSGAESDVSFRTVSVKGLEGEGTFLKGCAENSCGPQNNPRGIPRTAVTVRRLSLRFPFRLQSLQTAKP